MITLDIKPEICQTYAEFYGWTADSGTSCEDFTTMKLLERIKNDVTESANRTAIASVIVPDDVTDTTKGISQQERLKEAVQANEDAKAEAIQAERAVEAESITEVTAAK